MRKSTLPYQKDQLERCLKKCQMLYGEWLGMILWPIGNGASSSGEGGGGEAKKWRVKSQAVHSFTHYKIFIC